MGDLRYAFRTFLRTPGFTKYAAVLTLAPGIVNAGAPPAAVPYTDPERLVATRGSLADLRDLDASNQSFDGMAFWASKGKR